MCFEIHSNNKLIEFCLIQIFIEMSVALYLIITTILVIFAFIIGLLLGRTQSKVTKTEKSYDKKGKDEKERPKFYFNSYDSSDDSSQQTLWSKDRVPEDKTSQNLSQSKNPNNSSDIESVGEQDSSGDELLGDYHKYTSDVLQKLKSYETPPQVKSEDIKTKTNIKVKPKTKEFVDIDLMTV